jgi:hypothetical protein
MYNVYATYVGIVDRFCAAQQADTVYTMFLVLAVLEL